MFKHHLQSPHVYPSSAGWSHKTCNGDSTQQHQNKTFYHKQQSQKHEYTNKNTIILYHVIIPPISTQHQQYSLTSHTKRNNHILSLPHSFVKSRPPKFQLFFLLKPETARGNGPALSQALHEGVFLHPIDVKWESSAQRKLDPWESHDGPFWDSHIWIAHGI